MWQLYGEHPQECEFLGSDDASPTVLQACAWVADPSLRFY